LLGDLPLLGALFRSKQTTNDKRELIILVTPRVLQDRTSNIDDYNLKYENEESIKLLNEIK
jgi:type IV pilus assembly protein PilQ